MGSVERMFGEGEALSGELLLREWRIWAREQWENECLVTDDAPEPVHDAREHIDGLVAALGGVDAASLDGDALMGTVLALEDLQRRLDAVKASALGRLDHSGATEAKAGLGTKRWKAHRTHGSDATVGRELRVARTLERFEAFAEAMAEGYVSTDHLLALDAVCNDRIVEALVGIQDRLVRFAKHHRYKTFVAHLRQVAAMFDADGPEPDCGDRDTAAMARDLEGHLHVTLELTGHNAVEIEAIINTETDRQYRGAVTEHDATGVGVPAMGVLRARAVIELIRRAAVANPNATKPVVSVTLSVPADREGIPVGVRTLAGHEVDAVTAAVLFCDAHLQPVVVDGSGNPLDLGRSVRLFTPTQRNALAVRDGGCVFAGCDRPASHCDAHHEIDWHLGGSTDVHNGVLLCRRHHGLVHRGDPWSILHMHIDELPPELAEQHKVRAHSARLDPTVDVRVVRSPHGTVHLAQNAIDHQGPAPP